MNEAGLTYDFNAMRYVDDFDPESRAATPRATTRSWRTSWRTCAPSMRS